MKEIRELVHNHVHAYTCMYGCVGIKFEDQPLVGLSPPPVLMCHHAERAHCLGGQVAAVAGVGGKWGRKDLYSHRPHPIPMEYISHV